MCKNLYSHIPLGYITKKSGKQTKKYGIYQCIDCNNKYERQLYEAKLRGNYCTKCSAFHKKTRKDKNTGVYQTRLYQILQKMKSRCNNINNDAYEYYGGRGISVSEEWTQDFKSFEKWSISNGYKDDLTIDRINNDGDYEPSNCRWVSRKIQQRNQRKLRKNNTSGARGVSKHNNGFIVQITVDNKSIYLGHTENVFEGALMYDNYIVKHNLEHTKNFSNINDAIGFVQETKQMNFKDACEYVGSYVGITHIQNDNINMAVL